VSAGPHGRRLTRAERTAIVIWIVVPVSVGNTVYDLLVTRGLKEFKFRVAQHDAGQGPEASLADIMAVTVFDATWIGLLFGSIVLLAGCVTIRLLRRPDRPMPDGPMARWSMDRWPDGRWTDDPMTR
jgi:hypothetical protein